MYSIHFLLSSLFCHILECRQGVIYSIHFLLFSTHLSHIGMQAGVISANGVSTTDTGIAFRKISKWDKQHLFRANTFFIFISVHYLSFLVIVMCLFSNSLKGKLNHGGSKLMAKIWCKCNFQQWSFCISRIICLFWLRITQEESKTKFHGVDEIRGRDHDVEETRRERDQREACRVWSTRHDRSDGWPRFSLFFPTSHFFCYFLFVSFNFFQKVVKSTAVDRLTDTSKWANEEWWR